MTENLAVLKRDFLPPDILPHLANHRLEGSIAVQARQTLSETRWLLSLADDHPLIKGVVGWVDLRSPRVENDLASLSTHPKLVGIRHVAQDEPDDLFLSRPEFVQGIRKLRQFNLTYDLLVFPRQLPAAIDLVEQTPEQRHVLDHIAKPSIRDQSFEPWNVHIRQLARFPNVWCKLSGLVTEAAWNNWEKDDFEPYLDSVFECFGPGRLMFGSDWPVCLLAGSYDQVVAVVEDYLHQFPPETRAGIMGGNARTAYQLRG